MKKNLKRILLTMCSLVLCLSCCLGLCACDAEEVKNTTKAGIEASTDIIPVEYSQTLAQTVFASALNNSINQLAYKTNYIGVAYNQGVSVVGKEVELYAFTKNGIQNFVYNEDGVVHAYTKVDDSNYYDFNLTTNEYSTSNNYKQYSLVAQKSVFENIVNGKYYKGQEHVYTKLENLGNITYVDYVIENNLIIEINKTIFSSEFVCGFVSQKFDYSNQILDNLPVLPTSTNGYNPA